MAISAGGRRRVLLAAILGPLARVSRSQGGVPLTATPACGAAGHPTRSETAGPFFRPRSPERVSLIEPGLPGSTLVLTGRVLSTRCEPIVGALLDFWQADSAGEYDNDGFRLRGHQFADARGQYRLATVVPGLYPGRTRHIHVRVQAPHRSVLTTQVYFPGEPHNGRDALFRDDLLIMPEPGDRTSARFDFVLELG